MSSQIDFAYPWWLSYGHLLVFVIAALVLLIGLRRKWSKILVLLVGAVTLWAFSAFLVVRFVIDVNGKTFLPTENFFRAGTGRVLDLGAGTGRSSIMVLAARPQANLVALDLFGDSFEHHFGNSETPQQKLLTNLKLAGVDQRATIQTADMRKLPYEAASFDAVVSAYAIDHLNRQGSDETLLEAARVIKPGGDFLLMLVGKEPWSRFAFGPLLAHGGLRTPSWWSEHLQSAGFEVQEQGTKPLTLYFLARRRP